MGCDSCLQLDTRNLYGTSGNVFEDLLAPNEPTAACFGNSRSMASVPCEPVSLNTGRPAERANESERHTLNSAIPTPRFARKFSTWNPPSHAEGAYPQICMVELPRNRVSEMHYDNILDPSTFQCWKTSFKTEVRSCSNFPRKLCCGYKKCRWSHRWTILRLRSQLEGVDSRNVRCLTRRLRPF